MRCLVIILVLFTTCIISKAQSLSGQVIDAVSNEPLIGANLYVKSDWRRGASTNVYGYFKLDGVEPGDSLMVSYIGYQEAIYVVNSTSDVIIPMEESLVNMTEIVVTAEKMVAEEFSYKKIKKLDIYLNPSAKADPLLAVNSLPSATTLDESANISFRGSGPGETGIFFNNVPLYDAIRFSRLNGIGTFSIFNTSIVDEMLVFPGNPPLEYGNTTSGLIAIKTTEEIPEKAENSATITLASYGLSSTRPLSDKSLFTIFSNYQPSGIIKALNGEALEDILKFNSADLGLNFLSRLNENTILKVFNYSLTEGYDFHYQSPTFDGTFEQRKRRNFTVTNLRKNLGSSEITINSNLSFSKAEFGYAETDVEIKNFDAFVSGNYQYSKERFNLKAGMTLDYREQQFDGRFYAFSYAEGEGFPLDSTAGSTHVFRPEAYVYSKYYFNENIILGAGLRKNVPNDNQDHYLSGQFNLRVNLSEQANLVFAYGQYNKYNLPQNDFENTFLISSEQLSADYNYEADKFNFAVSLFQKQTDRPWERTELWGTEVFVKGNLTPKLVGQLSYALIDGTTTTIDGQEFNSSFDLNYFVRGNFEYRFSGYWSINSTFAFRDGAYYQPLADTRFDENLNVYEPILALQADQERLNGYGIIDLSVSRLIPISEKLTIIAFGSVSNVLNKKNIREFTYNFDYTQREDQLFSRRTMYFGVVLNF
ncbi:MAG: carboxypeptidase-like regulatory domain-containing protein [Fulvivirga sp.]